MKYVITIAFTCLSLPTFANQQTVDFLETYSDYKAEETGKKLNPKELGEALFEDATPDQLTEIFNLPTNEETQLSGLSDEEIEYIQATNPGNLVEKMAGKVTGTLAKKGGKFYWFVKTPAGSYNCMASPGKSTLTPRFRGKKPYATKKLHIVSKRKSYAGAKMPYVVWIRGGFATHYGKVTGRRESHGCIRIKCAKRFYNDVNRYGIANTYITVKNR